MLKQKLTMPMTVILFIARQQATHYTVHDIVMAFRSARLSNAGM